MIQTYMNEEIFEKLEMSKTEVTELTLRDLRCPNCRFLIDIFDILGILDHCADTDSYRIVQVQLSRIVLYHLKEKGFDREALRTEHLDQKKLDYLYTGKENRDKSQNYGLNFSDMDFLREFTGLSYQVMFTGVEV